MVGMIPKGKLENGGNLGTKDNYPTPAPPDSRERRKIGYGGRGKANPAAGALTRVLRKAHPLGS